MIGMLKILITVGLLHSIRDETVRMSSFVSDIRSYLIPSLCICSGRQLKLAMSSFVRLHVSGSISVNIENGFPIIGIYFLTENLKTD